MNPEPTLMTLLELAQTLNIDQGLVFAATTEPLIQNGMDRFDALAAVAAVAEALDYIAVNEPFQPDDTDGLYDPIAEIALAITDANEYRLNAWWSRNYSIQQLKAVADEFDTVLDLERESTDEPLIPWCWQHSVYRYIAAALRDVIRERSAA